MSKKINFIRQMSRVPPEPWFVPRQGRLEEMFNQHPEETERMGEDDQAEGKDEDDDLEAREDEDEDNLDEDIDNEGEDDVDLNDDTVAFDDTHDNEKFFMKGERHMKMSRQLFLRKKWVQRIKWGQFLSYTIDNYDALRENAREEAQETLVTYKVDKPNKWL
eukprot:gene17719-21129_t